MLNLKGIFGIALITTFVAFGILGCGSNEVAEVPVETVQVPPQTVDISVDVEQHADYGAADVVGAQAHEVPRVVSVNNTTRRPVEVSVDVEETYQVGAANVVGLPKQGFKVGSDVLKRVADTKIPTDVGVNVEFHHTYGTANIVGAQKPGLEIK